jgi:hypothetical protein
LEPKPIKIFPILKLLVGKKYNLLVVPLQFSLVKMGLLSPDIGDCCVLLKEK